MSTAVVMAFRNEGDQVFKTLTSLYNSLGGGRKINVYCINDCSDDKYNYHQDIMTAIERYRSKLSIHYKVNEGRFGSSVSKELGVQMAEDENVLLIDAHMRFIDNDWLNVVENTLHSKSGALYCLKTVGFDPETEEIKHHEHSGAYLETTWNEIFQSCWSKQINAINSIIPIAVLMGASYFFTKEYWNKLKGLVGLKLWGREEEYLSIKSWGLGGGCYLVNDCEIAHMYRKKSPTTFYTSDVWYNIQVIMRTLELDCFEDVSREMFRRNPVVAQKVANLLNENKSELISLREYYKDQGFDQNKFWSINRHFLKINKQQSEDVKLPSS